MAQAVLLDRLEETEREGGSEREGERPRGREGVKERERDGMKAALGGGEMKAC